MTPNVFLSLSGKDIETARAVWRALPRGLAFFYEKSFKTGEALISEMQEGVGRAQIFVLLASKASLESPWVGFEIDRARIRKIADDIDILVFPIEDGLVHSDFPQWMRDYWISPGKWGPRDIARYVQDRITQKYLIGGPEGIGVIGRGSLKDGASGVLMRGIVENNNQTPNVMFFTGTSQIGRRTFAKYFLKERIPALPNLSAGPEIRLPQFADIADVYRSLREQIDQSLSPEDMAQSLADFQSLNLEEKVQEIGRSAEYFADLGQAIFIATGSGLFEDNGQPKEWLKPLVIEMSKHPEVFLCLISNRQLKEEFFMDAPNAFQIKIPALSVNDTNTLILAFGTQVYGQPIVLSDATIALIGGHPAIAKAAARIANQRGARSIEVKPSAIFSIQEGILSENLAFDSLSYVQKEILCLLSWVPTLSGDVLEKTLEKRWDQAQDELVGALEDLVLSSLVVLHSDVYSISSEIRQMFRRKYGFGADGLLSDFGEVLSTEWELEVENGGFRSDLFDSFVFIYALGGKSLPAEFRKLILPSTLEEVLRQTYARGRDDHSLMSKVLEWGAIADGLQMDSAVRESIDGLVAQALIRLKKYAEAEAKIDVMARRGVRSVPFLMGFLRRRQDRLLDAIPHLRDAIIQKKQLRYSVQELGREPIKGIPFSV